MSHMKLRLSLAELHFLVGIGAIATAVTMLLAPDFAPHAVRVAVPRTIILSSVAMLLIGGSALLAAWTTLREDSSQVASVASSVGLLLAVLAQSALVGLQLRLQILLVVAPLISMILAGALYRAQHRREEGLTRRYSKMLPSITGLKIAGRD
ncbi:MAG TPA: hypothetical protein VNV65_04280 [Candidatus Solibacter sp.]|jgi:hypothetical protein|nr:hypothetical protein [Candidatus Solibacter sp.]